MQVTSCSLFLSTLLDKAFVTLVISVSFVFSSNLFIFNMGTFMSSSLFFLFCKFVLKSVFGNNPQNFDNIHYIYLTRCTVR